MIVTFYSFKGGVGRSMAMANVGQILADMGYRVIVCDWDVEAPGLERYLADEPARWDALRVAPGLIDLLREYKATLANPPRKPEGSSDRPTSDFAQVGKVWLRRPSSYTQDVTLEFKYSRGGTLRVLTAGARGDADFKRYATEVQNFDWEEFYTRWAGGAYIDFLKRDLSTAAATTAEVAARANAEQAATEAASAARMAAEAAAVAQAAEAAAKGAGPEQAAAVSAARKARDEHKKLRVAAQEAARAAAAADAVVIPPGAADIVLVDSRTGVTEHGGVATHHLADLVVLLCAANDQNIEGTHRMARSLGEDRVAGGEPRVPVLPIRARVERQSERDLLRNFRNKFDQALLAYVPNAVGDAQGFVDTSEISYMPFYSFVERVAAREAPEERDKELFEKYRVLAQAIVDCARGMSLLRPIQGEDSTRIAAAMPPAPQGTFELWVAPADREWAAPVQAALVAARLRMRPGAAATRGTETDAGLLLFVGPTTPIPWVRASFDYAVQKTVSRPDFLIVPVLAAGVDLASMPFLLRTRTVDMAGPGGGNAAAGILIALNVRAGPPREAASVSPYPGARAFLEDEARFFFGREAALIDLQSRCTSDTRWIHIDGEPGVGVSSFVQAALVPGIRRGLLTVGGPDVRVVTWRVDEQGVDGFYLGLASAVGSAEVLATAGDRDSRVLTALIGKVLATPTVLIVDRADALAGIDSARPQVDELLAGIAEDAGSWLIVTTSRSHATATLASVWPKLYGGRSPLIVSLASLTREELVAAASGPAKLTGLDWERGLLDRIVDDMSDTHAPIGLFAEALESLWRSRVETHLINAAYRAFGTPTERMVAIWEQRIQRLGADRDRAIRAVLALVRTTPVGGETSRALPLDAVKAAAGGGEEAERAIAELTRPPAILVVRGSAMVELVNDTLLRHSALLRGLIEANRARLVVRDDLEAAQALWERAHDVRLLPRGKQIARLREALPITSDESARFLDMASHHDERVRWKRRVWQGAAAAAALILVAVLWTSLRQWKRRAASELAARAMQARADARPTTALLRAVAAAQVADTPESRDALVAALADRHPLAVLEHEDMVIDAAFEADGQDMATIAADGKVCVWNASDGTRLATVTHEKPLTVAFLPGGRLVTAGLDACRVWQVADRAGTWTVVARCAREGDSLLGIQVGAERWVATLSLMSPVRLWDVQRGAIRPIDDGTAPSVAVAFDAKGERLVEASFDGRLRLIEVASGRLLGSTTPGVSVAAAALNGDGTLIATSGDAGLLLRLYKPGAQPSVSDSIQLHKYHADSGAALVFTSDGGALLTLVEGRPVVIDTSTRLLVPYGPTAIAFHEVQQVAMSADGTVIAGGAADGSVALWDRQAGQSRGDLKFHHGRIRRVVFSPDGTRLLTASEDGTAALWAVNPPIVDGASASFAELLRAGVARVPKGITPEMHQRLIK